MASSLKEYLKRYQSGADSDDKRKKRKKKKEPKKAAAGVLIVDEDPTWQKPVVLDKDDAHATDSSGEDNPVVDEDVEVKRLRRLEAIRAKKPYLSVSEDGSGWVSVSDTKDGDLIVSELQIRENRKLSNDLAPPQQVNRRRFHSPSPDGGGDGSHKRNCRRGSPEHGDRQQDVRRNSSSENMSPPRPGRRSSNSPRRAIRGRSPDADLTPPRRFGRAEPREGISSPRRSRRSSVEIELAPAREDRVGSSEVDLSPHRRGRRGSPGSNLSPPGRARRSSLEAGARRARKGSPVSDLSPPRCASRSSSGEDLSPPRRAGRGSPGEALSPPRRQRRSSRASDLSPPRRGSRVNLADSDLSPPRRASGGAHVSPTRHVNRSSPGKDLSPPRNARRGSPESDLSSPMRGRMNSADSDLSPTRQARGGSSGVHISPPRRKKAIDPMEDLSPPRKNSRISVDKSKQHAGSGSRFEELAGKDMSPPRRRERDHDSPVELANLPKAEHHPDGRSGAKPLLEEGRRKGGLYTGDQMREEINTKKAENLARFELLDPIKSGKGAEAVYRNQGKRISKEEKLKKVEEKPKEKKLEWGKGLAQKREVEAKALELELEKEKPFARTRDDPELDKMLKDRIRWGDPMAHLVKKKDPEMHLMDFGDDEKMKESGFIIPQTIPSHSWIKRGVDPPPNRYAIKPGRHWDGVDRSTGYEKELFKRQNEKRATHTEAYLWSVADM